MKINQVITSVLTIVFFTTCKSPSAKSDADLAGAKGADRGAKNQSVQIWCMQSSPRASYGLGMSTILGKKAAGLMTLQFDQVADDGFGYGDMTENGDGTSSENVMQSASYKKLYTESKDSDDLATSSEWKTAAAFVLPITHEKLTAPKHVLYIPNTVFTDHEFKARLKLFTRPEKTIILTCNQR